MLVWKREATFCIIINQMRGRGFLTLEDSGVADLAEKADEMLFRVIIMQ